MSQPLTRVASNLFGEHAKSQLKHSVFCLVSNAPSSLTPPSPLGRSVAGRDKNGCVGDKQISSKSGAKTRVKASKRAPLIFRAGQTKTSSYAGFLSCATLSSKHLNAFVFFLQLYISDNFVLQEME